MSGRDRAGGGGSARPAERRGRACVAGCWYLKPGLFSRSCQSGAVPISTPGRSANGTRSVGAGALQSGSDSGDCGSGTAKEQFAAALEDPSASVLDVFDQGRDRRNFVNYMSAKKGRSPWWCWPEVGVLGVSNERA